MEIVIENQVMPMDIWCFILDLITISPEDSTLTPKEIWIAIARNVKTLHSLSLTCRSIHLSIDVKRWSVIRTRYNIRGHSFGECLRDFVRIERARRCVDIVETMFGYSQTEVTFAVIGTRGQTKNRGEIRRIVLTGSKTKAILYYYSLDEEVRSYNIEPYLHDNNQVAYRVLSPVTNEREILTVLPRASSGSIVKEKTHISSLVPLLQRAFYAGSQLMYRYVSNGARIRYTHDTKKQSTVVSDVAKGNYHLLNINSISVDELLSSV